MKANPLVWALLVSLLGSGCDRQREPSVATTQTISNRSDAQVSEPPIGFVRDSDSSGRTNEWGFPIGESFEVTKAKAEKGHAVAQVQLGIYYLAGQGVTQDFAQAVNWLNKGAEQGAGLSEPTLGQCYFVLGYANYFGFGVPTNYVSAAKWYARAADLNVAMAQFRLGRCYANGEGVAQDDVEAFKWFHKAAIQGLEEAQVAVASNCFLGKGVRKDFGEAMLWSRKAADQGNSAAQFLLGSGYAGGHGVPKNDIEAYMWLSLSIANAKRDVERDAARQILDSLELAMSRGEIIEAQRLAAAFAPRKTAQGLQKNFPFTPEVLEHPKSSGTGFFISEDGYLVSNNHVVEGANQVRLVTSAGLISVKVVKVDAANDLALLKAEAKFAAASVAVNRSTTNIFDQFDPPNKFAALPVTGSRGVKLGGTVVTVGFPNIGLQGFAPKLAKGEIASLSGAGDDARYFQISVPVQPGNSGGALVDERGNVVGVVSAKLDASAALRSSGALPENVNYAIKSSYLLSFLESVPEVAAKLKEPQTREKKFEDVVKEAEQAAVLVLVY